MALADIRLKFRQSKDYTYEMLIRDLIELATELETRLKEIEDRLTAGGL